MTVMSIEENILSYTKELKLPAIRKDFKEQASDALKKDLDYTHYLCDLLEREYHLRLVNRRKRRMRIANFPYKKHLEDLKVDELPKDARKKLKELKSLGFIDSAQNVILAGNPGTGKTHIAVGLGIKACLEGHSVFFTTIPSLITQLKECQSQRTLRTMENRFEKYDLLVCDELGYISCDKQGAELLFTLLSLRGGRKSTIITTNLVFDRWVEIFGDPVLTAAMVDRLTHKALIVAMNGDSFRLKETLEMSKKGS